jgi:pilus assembly protein CpaE
MNLEPQHTISEAVTGAATSDAMVLKAFLSRHDSGAYVLCAPHRPAEADLIKPAHVTTLINQLSLEFPYVILDTSPGLGDVVLAVLEVATDGIWVCGMDVPSIRGLNHGLEVLRQLDLTPPSNTVVLNFADKHSGLSVQDVEATVGLPVDFLLPRSRTLPFTTNSGVPLLHGSRRDPAAKGLRKLVERFSHEQPAPTSNLPVRGDTP